MRIFAAGIATETNTFCPIPTGIDDFTPKSLDAWRDMARAQSHDLVEGFMARAQPSGTTTRQAYESLRDRMLEDLRRAGPVDVVLLFLHGAMVAQDYDDCEEDMVRCVRAIVGPGVVIGVELDLHCHLSASKIDAADIVVTYKEYPHWDINDRAREVFDLAVRTKRGEIRPTMALFDCRMLGLYPTSSQPLRRFVDEMSEGERGEGVLSISFGHGFQFADIPHAGAKMLVVTDGDASLAQRVAQEFGLRVHGLRREIAVDRLSLPLDDALSRALASKTPPVVVADQSDNTGAGAPGDATFALRWLLDRQPVHAAIAIFYDPEVVQIATRAGVGARLPVRLGGKLGPTSGQPVDIEVEVLSLAANYMHKFPQLSGPPSLFSAGDVVALRCGGIDIVVSSRRCQCFSPSIFSDLGIDPARKQVLVVKSTQHFYGAFSPIAGEVIYMAGPGAASPDPELIHYRRLDTSRMYPWVEQPFDAEG
jgi:microcystin degradation protein MlrC